MEGKMGQIPQILATWDRKGICQAKKKTHAQSSSSHPRTSSKLADSSSSSQTV